MRQRQVLHDVLRVGVLPRARVTLLAMLGFCGWLASAATVLPPEQDVRNTVRAILARREFVPPPQNLLDRLTEVALRAVGRVVEWLLRPLSWLVDKLTELAGAGSPMALWMVVGLLVGLLLLIIFHIYYMLSGAFGTGTRRRVGRVAGAVPLHAPDLLGRARAAAAAGDFRDAVRLIYKAALLTLDQAGIIRYDPSHTNWEYAHEVATREHLGPIFARLTSIADRAMYSDAPVTRDHYTQSFEFLAQTQELLK